MKADPVAAHDSRLLVRHSGFQYVLAGSCAPPPAPDHGLSINIGPPAWATCRQAGRVQRHLRTPGGINFVPAGLPSAWNLESPLTLFKLRVPQCLLRTAAEDMGFDIRTCELRPGVQVRSAQIEHIARALKAEADAGNPNGVLFNESLGLALSVLLVRRFSRPLPAIQIFRSGLSQQQLSRVTEYIECNLGQEDLSLRLLAAVAGTSISHFKSLFRIATGMPVHRFVVQRRVERAAALLREGSLAISEVASETGFAHATHMARWTRRLLGVTPGSLKRGQL